MRYRSSLIIVSCALAAACANPAASNTADSSSPTPTPTASGQQPSTTIIVQPGQQAPQAPPKVIVTSSPRPAATRPSITTSAKTKVRAKGKCRDRAVANHFPASIRLTSLLLANHRLASLLLASHRLARQPSTSRTWTPSRTTPPGVWP